jgi:hypothetical protein
VTRFISTAMAAHLPELLLASGATLAAAVGIAALVGPTQVVGRVIEFTFLKRAYPLLSARLATLAPQTSSASACSALRPPPRSPNGILTIAIGDSLVPARIVQAGAPFLFGIAVERWGDSALWLSSMLGLSACLALGVMAADMKKVPSAIEAG